MSTATHSQALAPPHKKIARFYRPELDALRFFAFFLVLLAHGPRLGGSGLVAAFYNRFASIGVYGLSAFFFLSSYLITELLLRERANSGTVHLKAFYIRRILRIWPLYYLAVGAGILIGFWSPVYHISHFQAASLLFLVGYLPGRIASPIGPLWSISVEELFYLVWPWLAKAGERVILLFAVGLIPVAVTAAALSSDDWYNPLAQFVYFSAGALTCFWTREHDWRPSLASRLLLFALALALWLSVPSVYEHVAFTYAKPISYGLTCAGCVSSFLSVFNVPAGAVPSALRYLGQISYGLYVFHLPLMRWLEPLMAKYAGHGRVPIHLGLTLCLTILVAGVSYRYWETPFLKLKRRFEFVRSRDSAA